MKLKGWAVAGGLVLLASGAPRAATEANFSANTTGDLVELCTATPDNPIGTAPSISARVSRRVRSSSKCRIKLHSADRSCSACRIPHLAAFKR